MRPSKRFILRSTDSIGSIRWPIAILMAFLMGKVAMAQDEPMAPSFFPDQTPITLADLHREYKQLGLPLPPKGARLVFADESQAGPAQGIVQRQPETLALCFEIQPGHKGQPGEFLIGLETRASRVPVQELRSPIDMRIVAGLFGSVAADPDQPVVWQPWFDRDLILAIQCHAEGQNELAEFLLDRCRARTPIPLKKRLLLIAWNHWVDQLTMPDSDRGALAKRLKEMMAKNPECVVDSTRQLVADLEITLKSPANRNVQNEVFIERLIEYSHRTDCELYVIQEGDSIFERYRNDRMRNRASTGVILSLAELGFEVVPSLMDHINDRRLTRCRSSHQPQEHFQDEMMRVGHHVLGLLNQWVDHPNQEFEGERDLQFYQSWWQEVCKEGEENYLAKNLWPNKAINNTIPYWPYLEMIFHKYPNRLPSIYQDNLDKRPECLSHQIVDLLAKGPFSKEEKIRWLMPGVKHRRAEHRLHALAALQTVDIKRFEEAWLEVMGVHLQGDLKWEDSPFCTGVAGLARNADDAQVWQLLEKVTKRAPVEHRGRFLNDFCCSYFDKSVKLQIRFLLQFLDDDSLWEQRLPRPPFEENAQFISMTKVEIRNLAAVKLASLWELPEKEEEPTSPEEWKKLRDKVRGLAQNELKEK